MTDPNFHHGRIKNLCGLAPPLEPHEMGLGHESQHPVPARRRGLPHLQSSRHLSVRRPPLRHRGLQGGVLLRKRRGRGLLHREKSSNLIRDIKGQVFFLVSQKCEQDEFLATNFADEHWECRKIGGEGGLVNDELEERELTRCPVGGYDICPWLGTPAPTPDPSQVTENPLGTCRCDGELWVSEGCSYGFYCNETLPNGGELKICPEVR